MKNKQKKKLGEWLQSLRKMKDSYETEVNGANACFE